MHGRIKVKTTAEQEEERRKEQGKKLKIFKKASAIAFDKVERKEYDEAGLEVTGQILSKISDFTSIWNYRKNAFLAMKNAKSEDEMQKFSSNELEFLATCLRNNPKSYGCWHHRCFILLNMPKPDWVKELKLCNQFLQLDERNFHCWDYRRFVVRNSTPEVSIESEIQCTSNLIESNFSNYSAWHYRSKLLPQKYPSEKTNEQSIEEKKLLEELEYVQNAFFTDPNDQSAWFYHKWLLGRGEKEQLLLYAQANRATSSLTCVFRKPISLQELSDAKIKVDDVQQDGVWESLISSNVKYFNAWVFKCTDNFTDKLLFLAFGYLCQNVELKLENDVEISSWSNFSKKEFCHELSDTKSLLLRSELGSCIELNDLEPGNKWVVLTLVQLMCVIGADAYKDEIEKYLADLQKIDLIRKNYYADLRSKIVVERTFTKFAENPENLTLNLSNMSLTRLCHLQYFCTIKILDLSKNSLTKLSEPFYLLLNCEEILADDNEICSISGLQNMRCLRKLSLNHNSLSHINDLKPLLSCPDLKFLSVMKNKLDCSDVEVKLYLSVENVQL